MEHRSPPRPTRRRIRLRRAAACLIAVAVAAPTGALGESGPLSDEEVFEQVFGRPEGPSRVMASLLVDGLQDGEVLVEVVTAEDSLRIAAAPVLEALSEKLDRAVLRKFEAAAGGQAWLSAAVLSDLGLAVRYDPQRLELHVAVPPELSRASTLQLGAHGAPPEAAHALAPSAVSGYLNARGSGRAIVWSEDDRSSARRSSLRLDLESAVQVRGWVLEGQALANGGSAAGWRRGDVRLSRDDPELALRYTAGDLGVPSTGLQDGLPIVGIGVARNFALQPYRHTRPMPGYVFVLERASTVDIFVNRARVRSVSLPPGRHDLRDLPFSAGLNEVVLAIRDDLGQERWLRFSAAIAGELLAPGLHQFSYSFGAPREHERGGRGYGWATPVLSVRHRLGVTERLTAGGHIDAGWDRQVGGLQGIRATPVGNLGVDLALSVDREVGTGGAAALRYDFFRSDGGTALSRSFQATLRHATAGFRTLGQDRSRGARGTELSVGAGRRFGERTRASIDLRYQVGRETVRDAGTAGVTLSRSFGNGIELSLNAQLRGSPSNDEASAFLNMSWSLPETRQSFRASVRGSSRSGTNNQAAWSHHSGHPSGGLALAASVSESASEDGASASVGYASSRGTASLSQTMAMRPGESGSSGSATVDLASAIVFAGGRFAVSRPVDGAFALIAPNEALRDQTIGVNRAGSDFAARTGWLGPAVIPNLQAYAATPVRVEAPDLPVGYSLGPGTHWLRPTHKSGTLLIVGEEGTVSLRGTLRRADGRPAALLSGELISLDDPDDAAVLLFTNRAGRFGLEAVRPGRYEIRLADTDVEPIRFAIPAGHVGGYSVGVLRVAAAHDPL